MAGLLSTQQFVRPIHGVDIEQDEFDKMMIPFDPSNEGGKEEESVKRETEELGERRCKAVKVEKMPSQEEIDEHMVTHLPYRSWCKFCVAGKAKSSGHRTGKREVGSIPVVSLDYMFMGSETESANQMPILVMSDNTTKMKFATVVHRKGTHPWSIRRVVNDLSLLGYSKLVLKSDGEEAITALKRLVKAEVAQDIVSEESVAYDSKSNCEVERAVQTIQGQIRALKESLEGRLGAIIEGSHHCVPWLVRHSASLLNKFQVGSDGFTSQEIWKCKRFRRMLAEFGERSCT